MTMNSIGRYEQHAEPNREFVECAITEVSEIAQRQGITAANLIQMLDSGMRIADFLTAMGGSPSADHIIDHDTS
jgi:hypothetical protein